MQWLGVVLGVVLVAAAIYYFIVGFFPASGISRGMRSRMEFAADVGRAKGRVPNTDAFYAWMLRTKPRVALIVILLLLGAALFIRAAIRS